MRRLNANFRSRDYFSNLLSAPFLLITFYICHSFDRYWEKFMVANVELIKTDCAPVCKNKVFFFF